MKETIRLFGIIAIVAVIAFTMTACPDDGGNGNEGEDDRPEIPEEMSGKTALQYFTDNGIKAGWNLGNTLDAVSIPSAATETAWGNPAATQALFNGAKESGFDMVRIGCTWIGHIGSAPDYKVSEDRLKRVAEVVGYAKTAGFKAVVINIHHDGNYTQPEKGTWGFVDFKGAVGNATKKAAIQSQIGVVWTQIAEYFKNYGDYLIFETLNEVHSGNWGTDAPNNEQNILFDWNQAALSAIRETGGNNATRFVAVPGLGSTEPGTVIAAHARGKLLPNDGANGTKNLIVSVHFYDPWRYTVADATGQGGDSLLHTWGTSAEKSHLASEIGSLKTTFIDNNIAVYIGEWGAPTQTRSSMSTDIKNTHLDYMGSVAGAARSNGVVPILWDDGGNFKCLERSNGKPKAGLWKDVLDKIMSSIASATPPVIGGPPTPNPITGNMGNWDYGYEDSVTRNYRQACWTFSGNPLATFKSATTLKLVLETDPSATMQIVWQDTATWGWNSKDILSATGTAIGGSGTSWDAGTKTLTITLATALTNYANIASHSEVKLVIAYYGGPNINTLGIVSADLE